MIQPETADEMRANEFYRAMVGHLREAGVRFLVGGAYALGHYTGIARRTKDLDIFVHPGECDAVLAVLAAGGCATEVTSPVWLAKAFCGDDYVDVIFSSGNGIAEVDETWFEHAVDAEILGVPVQLCAPEEMIWSKGYIMERQRYDGADVAHLIRARGRTIDWDHLLARFGDHWRVLLAHLVLFDFVYPGEHDAVPAWVMQRLTERLADERAHPPPDERWCRGTLLSRHQYRIDIERWGYRDGRLWPKGRMTPQQAAAIDREP
jgi:hypothetical protein